VTATDTDGMDSCGYSLDAGVGNVSLSNSGDYWTDTNASMIQGSHTANFYCNDTSNNVNDTEEVTFFIDSINPSVSSLTESPSDPATYSSTQSYQFNATVTDTNLQSVWLDFNGTNYTATNTGDVYNVTFLSLSAGTYNYYFWAYGKWNTK